MIIKSSINYCRRFMAVGLLVLFVSLAQIRDAHAYLDIETSGNILQTIIAGLLVSTLFIYSLWIKVGQFFGLLFSKRKKNN